MQIPPQYNRLMPYLIVTNATAFVEFMKTVFDAAEQLIVPRSEGIIMHGELRIGDAVIMIADATPEFEAQSAGMFIYVQDVENTYTKALAAGAISTMPLTKAEYGYTCGFKDTFGNTWWPTQPDR